MKRYIGGLKNRKSAPMPGSSGGGGWRSVAVVGSGGWGHGRGSGRGAGAGAGSWGVAGWVGGRCGGYLMQGKRVRAGRVGGGISGGLDGESRRCDTVVYDCVGNPLVIIEYKAAEIPLTQAVFDQIYRYNIVLRVKYLIVTNGQELYCCRMDYDSLSSQFLDVLPDYSEL